MQSSLELRSKVLKDFDQLLADIGFAKRAQGIFTLDLAPQMMGWIGLNHATRDRGEVVEVNATVGVRHQPTEELVAELRGTEYEDFVSPTVSIHLGYLMPEHRYRPWLFSGADYDMSQARSAMKALRDHGIPFMVKNQTLDQILDSISKMPALRDKEQHRFRMPVMLYLFHNVAGAEAQLQESLDEIGTRQDPAARMFQGFAANLRRRMTN